MKKARGACWVCARMFWYGVDTVPSVPVDRNDVAVADISRAYRKAPICNPCVGDINRDQGPDNGPYLDADPYGEAPEDHPDMRGGYFVAGGVIIRLGMGSARIGLSPVAGLPRDVQPDPAPEPHLSWTNSDGKRTCHPWCWCEIERHKQKVNS